jgi:integrase
MLRDGRRDGAGGLAPKTIRNIHGVLGLALKKALTWQLNWSNPAIGVTLPKIEHKEVKVLTKAQSGTLLQALEGRWLYPIVLLALTTGMRRGEILALKWSNINLDEGWLRVIQSVEQTKSGKRLKDVKTKHGRRRISLPLMTVNMLRLQKAHQAEQLLGLGVRQSDDTLTFTSKDGQLRDPLYVSTSFREFMAQIDLPKVTFHGLRHTHISHLLEDGHPIKTVSSRAGHATVSITLDIYAHVLPDSQEKLAAAYGVDLEGMVEQARNKK